MTRSSSSTPEPMAFGVFQDPNDKSRTHTASNVDEANRLRFIGWREIAQPTPENDWVKQAETAQYEADAAASETAAAEQSTSDPQ